jgi:hypothetical protein
MLLSRFINHFVWMCYICVLYVPSYSEVKRVYDVCQYIFSGEGEYALDMHYIFSQHILVKMSTLPLRISMSHLC